MIPQIISRVLLGSTLLCASMCGCGDDGGNYTYLRVETTDLTTVENVNQVYEVGDTLYFKTEIPFQLTATSSEAINLRELEIRDRGVGFSILLYKETGFGTYGTVPLTQEFLVADVGTVDVYENFIQLSCDRTAIGFENRFGIVLNEPGTYQIRARGGGSFPINYFVDVMDNDLSIGINAYLSQSDENGDFTFVVK
jgi:hypothetical protein